MAVEICKRIKICQQKGYISALWWRCGSIDVGLLIKGTSVLSIMFYYFKSPESNMNELLIGSKFKYGNLNVCFTCAFLYLLLSLRTFKYSWM